MYITLSVNLYDGFLLMYAEKDADETLPYKFLIGLMHTLKNHPEFTQEITNILVGWLDLYRDQHLEDEHNNRKKEEYLRDVFTPLIAEVPF